MSQSIRQFHRWVSIAFTVTVIANIVVMSLRAGQPPAWVTYSPLLPLFLLLFTGLYLFVLPYATKWRSVGPSSQTVDIR
jgi:membrane protein CcdC involved in cytochrome C biogenesis